MTSTFLIGGGWRFETFPQTFGRFLQSASKNQRRKIAIVVAEEPDADSQEQFLRFSKHLNQLVCRRMKRLI
jgi:chorismate-pyruvate lyase